MSVVELRSRTTVAGVERFLSGWGRTAPSSCRVLRPEHPEEVAQALSSAASLGTGVIARGAGRSYGDAAQNEGGAVLDMTALRRIISIDTELLLLRAQAGATIAEMMAALAPHDLTLPVVPGTRHVTLAGAIASDIHGKNHHRDGGFARYRSEERRVGKEGRYWRDWSSDVCSSDLHAPRRPGHAPRDAGGSDCE